MSATNGSNPRLDRIEKLIEQTVRATRESELANKKAHARFESDMRRWESNLRRWTALGVKEARNQRKRSDEMDKKFDKKIEQLASAQLLTEDTLKKFIASLERGRNGR